MLLSSRKLIDRICEYIAKIEKEIKSLKLEKKVGTCYTQNIKVIDEKIIDLEGQIFALETVLDLLPECKERN